MSRITLSPDSSEWLQSSTWINQNHPESGLFRVYWKDAEWRSRGGATLNPSESNCKIHTDCSGHLRYEWEYKDGKMADGISRGWWPDGTLKQERTWKNGKLNGLFIQYNEDGNKQKEGNYIDGKPCGIWILWYKNGQKEFEKTYKDGKYHGLETRWYQNGNKEFEGTYKDGKKEGLWTHWYENGQKEFEITYKNFKKYKVRK